MSKIIIVFLIFALSSFAPSTVYNGASSFHYSLWIGEMAEWFWCVYVSAPIEMQAKYKVVLSWNHTIVCKPGALICYRIFGVSFSLEVEKGLRRDKCRLVKTSYLPYGKISKTWKYRENGKIRKSKKIEECLFLQISTLSKNEWTLPNKREISPIPFRDDNYISPARG